MEELQAVTWQVNERSSNSYSRGQDVKRILPCGRFVIRCLTEHKQDASVSYSHSKNPHLLRNPLVPLSKEKISKGLQSLLFNSCTNCCEGRSAPSLETLLQGGVSVSVTCSICNYTEKWVKSILPFFCLVCLLPDCTDQRHSVSLPLNPLPYHRYTWNKF